MGFFRCFTIIPALMFGFSTSLCKINIIWCNIDIQQEDIKHTEFLNEEVIYG